MSQYVLEVSKKGLTFLNICVIDALFRPRLNAQFNRFRPTFENRYYNMNELNSVFSIYSKNPQTLLVTISEKKDKEIHTYQIEDSSHKGMNNIFR